VAVDAQGDAVLFALNDPNGIDALRADFLPDAFDAVSKIPGQNKFADRTLGACGTRNIDKLFGQLGELVAIDALQHIR